MNRRMEGIISSPSLYASSKHRSVVQLPSAFLFEDHFCNNNLIIIIIIFKIVILIKKTVGLANILCSVWYLIGETVHLVLLFAECRKVKIFL